MGIMLTVLALSGGSAALSRADIVINEIMYNSPGSPDVEYIELYNNGQASVDLTGWYLLDDDPAHPHCLLFGTLDAGQYLVVANDLTLFQAQYPEVTNLSPIAFDSGGTGFGLGNSGDIVHLYTVGDDLHDAVPYEDGGAWPGTADGDGPSLELVNPFFDNSVGSSWDPSTMDWGTPGQQNSAYMDNQPPTIHDTDREPRLPQVDDPVLITARVSDPEGLDRVELFVDLGAGFVSQPMYDDGAHGDGAPADSLFGATIAVQSAGTLVHYYVAAWDQLGQVTTKPSDAPVRFHGYTVGYEPPNGLWVSEIMADNGTTLADEFGQYDDWVEIQNFSGDAIDLTGMFLTDNLGDHRKWMLPPVTLDGQEYLIIWCDDEPEQGAFHASFKLSDGGEDIGLYDSEDHGNTLIHGFSFGLQNTDVAFGMILGVVGLPNRDTSWNLWTPEPEYQNQPTPGEFNEEPRPAVVINELLTTSDSGGIDDWVELYNRSPQDVAIGGWGISDDLDEPLKYTFAAGTILASGEYLVIDELELGFGFSSLGEVVTLTAADGATAVDYLSFGPQTADRTYGRSGGGLSYWAQMDPTPGTINPNFLSPVDDGPGLPAALRISGVHPNPFNPSARIHFELPRQAAVTVDIYGVNGRRVRTLRLGVMAAGAQSVVFDGRDDSGRALASGIWFARVQGGPETATVKMTLVK